MGAASVGDMQGEVNNRRYPARPHAFPRLLNMAVLTAQRRQFEVEFQLTSQEKGLTRLDEDENRILFTSTVENRPKVEVYNFSIGHLRRAV